MWIQTITGDQKQELAPLLRQFQFPGDNNGCTYFVDLVILTTTSCFDQCLIDVIDCDRPPENTIKMTLGIWI